MFHTILWLSITYLKDFKFFQRYFDDTIEKQSLCNLPPEWHVRLPLEEKKVKRILFVGDVHGCLLELIELLNKVGFYESDDIIAIFVGDICNKGPQSAETVRHLRELGPKVLSVRGNHEQAVLTRLQLFDRGVELPQKYLWILQLTEEDRLFLKQLPFTIYIPSLNVIVVHGGLVPGKQLDEQEPNDMLSMRNYVHEALSGSKESNKGLPWGSQWEGPEFVIFGHDARRRLQKYQHAIGLDTGCVYGEELTGFLVDVNYGKSSFQNGRLVSVHAHSAYAFD